MSNADRTAGRKQILDVDGPLIEVIVTVPLQLVSILAKAGFPASPVARGLAQIDTGAEVSAVDASVFSALEIPVVEREMIRTVHGFSELDLYNASVSFPELSVEPQSLVLVPGGDLKRPSASGGEIIMLIGRDLLRLFRFVYDGPASTFSISV